MLYRHSVQTLLLASRQPAEGKVTTVISTAVSICIWGVSIANLPPLTLRPDGPSPLNPAEPAALEHVRRLFRKTGNANDHLLIDTAPLMNPSDPAILSKLVDGVILSCAGGDRSTRGITRLTKQEC